MRHMSNVEFESVPSEANRNEVVIRAYEGGKLVEHYKFIRIQTRTGKTHVRIVETTTPYYVFQPHDHERAAKRAAKEYFEAQP